MTTLLIDLEGVSLSPGTVQRNHQQATGPFPQRVRNDERFELADHAVVTPESEFCVESLLEVARARSGALRSGGCLVPATMSLVGRANWWLPQWLDRILPHLDLEGAPKDAELIEIEPGRELIAA